MARRYAKQKKHHFLRNVLLLFLAVVIVAGALYFSINNLGCATELLQDSLYPIKYSDYVDNASEKYNLDKAFIYAVIRTESGFDPDAESNVGAIGLMQIMPESFEWMQNLRGEELEESKLYDPQTNIDYGCYLLRYFWDYYGNKKSAIAAYNAGFVVGDWLDDSSYSEDGKTLDSIPYDETSDYVDKVLSAEKMYNKLYFS